MATSPQPAVEEKSCTEVTSPSSPQPSIADVRSVQKTEEEDSHSLQAVSLDGINFCFNYLFNLVI